MFKDHTPHILRAYLDEWCGGTVPPTIVTFDKAEEEVSVGIFTDDSHVHAGVVAAPVSIETFLLPPEAKIDQDAVSKYACNALAAFTQRENRPLGN